MGTDNFARIHRSVSSQVFEQTDDVFARIIDYLLALMVQHGSIKEQCKQELLTAERDPACKYLYN